MRPPTVGEGQDNDNLVGLGGTRNRNLHGVEMCAETRIIAERQRHVYRRSQLFRPPS